MLHDVSGHNTLRIAVVLAALSLGTLRFMLAGGPVALVHQEHTGGDSRWTWVGFK